MVDKKLNTSLPSHILHHKCDYTMCQSPKGEYPEQMGNTQLNLLGKMKNMAEMYIQ
jgi:hypothetical protein